MIDYAPPQIQAVAAACEVFDDACAQRVKEAIDAYCFGTDWPRVTVPVSRCFMATPKSRWDRKPWLQEREPYSVRSMKAVFSHGMSPIATPSASASLFPARGN